MTAFGAKLAVARAVGAASRVSGRGGGTTLPGRLLLRAALGAVVLFVVFFVLVMISPRSIGMGDAKLAALLGLYLGRLGHGRLRGRGPRVLRNNMAYAAPSKRCAAA